MKYKLRIGLNISFILIIHTSFLNAQFYTLETKNLTLVYLGKPHEYLVSHLGRCFENSLGFHRHLFNYTPNEKTTVFLQDFSDFHKGLNQKHQDIKALGGIRPIDPNNLRKYLQPQNKGRIKLQLQNYPELSEFLIKYGYEIDNNWEKSFIG